MAKISKSLDAGLGATLHPRENTFITGNLASLNAELDLGADGCSTVSLAVSGTYVGTLIVEGSVDGTSWDGIAVLPVLGSQGQVYVFTLASAAVGRWQGMCAGFKQVRVRMSAYTSGTAICYLVADISPFQLIALPRSADQNQTGAAATGVALTLTIPNPGANMFNYLTRLVIQRHTSAALTAGSTPILVTTTNWNARVFSFPADAAAQGQVATEIVEPATPIRLGSANAATTVIMPATTGVIWRATADYFVGPYS